MNVQTGVPRVSDREREIDWTRIDTTLEHTGKKIILPGDPEEMPIAAGIEALQRIQAAEAQTYSVTETVEGLPWDAAVAVFRAMQEIYGVALPKSVMTWFGKRDPTFLSVKTGPGDKDLIQVPVGQFTLPGMTSDVTLGIDEGGAWISGTVNRKDRARLVEIAMRARAIVNTDSIYKGRAIALKVDCDGDLDVTDQPDFFDVSEVRETDMIHNEMTAGIIATSILAPIKHTASCRKHKIPLKRGILLEGRFGCGKSLTARVTARVAIDHGWTFIVLERAQGLAAALMVANRYQPCVVFAEDIDRFGDRTKEKVNDLVNMMDGLVPIGSSIMTILTTNHVENIDKALLRPGRLDAVISIDAPDAVTVQKLIRHYAAENLPDDVALETVAEALAGQIPASIAEVVKRAKLAMLTEDREMLSEADLTTATESAVRHLALLSDRPAEKSLGDRLAENLRDVVLAAGADDPLVKVMEAFRQEAVRLRKAMENA